MTEKGTNPSAPSSGDEALRSAGQTVAMRAGQREEKSCECRKALEAILADCTAPDCRHVACRIARDALVTPCQREEWLLDKTRLWAENVRLTGVIEEMKRIVVGDESFGSVVDLLFYAPLREAESTIRELRTQRSAAPATDSNAPSVDQQEQKHESA